MRFRKKAFFFGWFTFLFLLACGGSGTGPTSGPVSGYIVDEPGGAAVAGSVLSVSRTGETGQSDTRGRFALKGHEGRFIVTASKGGHAQSRWLNLSLRSGEEENIILHQPKVFCTDWPARAPEVTVSGVEPRGRISGTVDLEIAAKGSNPIDSIGVKLGSVDQESLTLQYAERISFSWNTMDLPDGPTYLLVTVKDINLNSTHVKIPVVLSNGAMDSVAPGSVSGSTVRCFTVADKEDANKTLIFSTLQWSAVTGARGYRIYRTGDEEQATELVGILYGNASIRYTDYSPNLLPGAVLRYEICAFNNHGEGERTTAPPVTVLERFDVRIQSPANGQGEVSSRNPVFTWEVNKTVGDVQYYRLLLLKYNDPKDSTLWNAEFRNTTSATYPGNLSPRTVYHWDILNAYAAKDRYVDPIVGDTYRSTSFPGPSRKDPYTASFRLVTSSRNGAFTFTTAGDGTAETTAASPTKGKILARIRPGADPEAIAGGYGMKLKKTFRIGKMVYGIFEMAEGRKAEAEAVMERIRQDERLTYAEPAPTFRLHRVPDDPQYAPRQYCHIKMQSEKAWDVETGSEKTILAIIDTGIDGTHPEFADRLVTGHNFSTDEDVPPGVHFDSYGHGTHVAGIAAATGDNGIGVAGVDWKSRIMALKVNDEGDEVAEYVVESIPWAVDHGARVLNLSLGSPGYSQALQDAVTYACQQGASVVVSMGNNYTAIVQFPAASQGTIAIGSTNGRDEVSVFSTWGNHISVSAPGEEILSTSKKNHGYVSASGTSMSAPQIAGALALLKSAHPDWSIEEIRSHLEATADDVGEPGFDWKTGWGRLNLYRLLSSPKSPNKYARLRILVTDAEGRGLEGTDVLLTDAEGKTVATVKTDGEGYAYFFYLSAGGRYAASARYRGARGATEETFSLRPGAANPDVAIRIAGAST